MKEKYRVRALGSSLNTVRLPFETIGRRVIKVAVEANHESGPARLG